MSQESFFPPRNENRCNIRADKNKTVYWFTSEGATGRRIAGKLLLEGLDFPIVPFITCALRSNIGRMEMKRRIGNCSYWLLTLMIQFPCREYQNESTGRGGERWEDNKQNLEEGRWFRGRMDPIHTMMKAKNFKCWSPLQFLQETECNPQKDINLFDGKNWTGFGNSFVLVFFFSIFS